MVSEPETAIAEKPAKGKGGKPSPAKSNASTSRRKYEIVVPEGWTPGPYPTSYRDRYGKLWRLIPVKAADGKYYTQRRPVCETTVKDAKIQRQDFYHPEVGWLREGVKHETDRSPQEIMEDGSTTVSAFPD